LDEESDEELEFKCNNEDKSIPSEKARTIFVLEDGLVYGLQNILSVAENRAIMVKRTFQGKLINILVNIECNIILSCITP
jgi:hypothetical protein